MAAPCTAAAEPQMIVEPEPSPVRVGLVAAVGELSRVATSVEQLQSALSPLLRRAGEAARAAQSLDDITQHLQGLAEFLSAVAHDCPPEWRLDLQASGARLTLHSQKLRLTSTEPATTSAGLPLPAHPASGELELW